jgi:hypothetical protein
MSSAEGQGQSQCQGQAVMKQNRAVQSLDTQSKGGTSSHIYHSRQLKEVAFPHLMKIVQGLPW